MRIVVPHAGSAFFCLAFLIGAGSHATSLLAAEQASTVATKPDQIKQLIATVNQVGPKGAGHAPAAAAIQELSKLDGAQLLTVVAAIQDDNLLAANWIRSAVESIARRQVKSGGSLPTAELEAFILDTSHSDRGRRLAYELLVQVDATAPRRLLPGLLNDNSLELRRDAVAREIARIAKAAKGEKVEDRELAAKQYLDVLKSTRDIDQIQDLVERLKKLKEPVDVARHFGFLQTWQLIGPFDNREMKGYAVAYPPEEKLEFNAELAGKQGAVKWTSHTTDDPYGMVDLNKAMTRHKGAIAYAATTFDSAAERPVELRFGSMNACKVWLNGKLLLEREVYHAATDIDQYVAKGTLKPGRNVILLKVCQNEQTEQWAQQWSFQLRVCDSRGTAVLSTDRPAMPVAPSADQQVGLANPSK